jgi:serine/threonine-protein kinase
MAAPFDQDGLEMTGEATAMIAGVGWREWAPDLAIADEGTLVYTTGTEAGRTGQPVWVSRDGSVEIVAADWTDRATEVALSPDGAELAVSIEAPRERNIWVRRLEDGAVSKLTFAGLRNAWPMWTDDGRAVAFLSNRGVNTDMYLRLRDGTSRAEILLDIPEALGEVHLTSNGEWVLYTVGVGNSRDVMARRLSGDSTPVPIAVSDFREGSPAVSPDGRWVAYESYETGIQEVFVQSFPDAAGGRWSIGGGFDPKWARDGRELFYVNHDDELVTVEIRSDMVPPMGRERVLFSVAGYLNDGNYYDVAPDGQRFVFVRPSEQQFDHMELIVVENFFEELETKVVE